MNILHSLVWLNLGIVSIAVAADNLHGKVTLSGSIYSPPCTIATESLDQSIDMGILPISVLKQWGQSPQRPFTIDLVNCRLVSVNGDAWRAFSVTFEGPADKYGFTLFGHGAGASLRVNDENGNPVQPGSPLPTQAQPLNGRTLKYGLRVISNYSPYKPGNFQTTLRFKLDYY